MTEPSGSATASTAATDQSGPGKKGKALTPVALSVLAALAAALNSGNIRQAQRQKTILLKRQDYPFPSPVQEEFLRLDARLRELEDWQRFATLPKQIELCEKMENLDRQMQIHPLEKAQAIKELQSAWRALGPSNAREVHKLWQRFSAAGDRAYAPCSQYFDQQNAQRQQHLLERIRICETLEQYSAKYDWSTVNWQGLSQEVKRAKTQWKQFSDIPHASRREMNKRFSSALSLVDEKLDSEQARNHEFKRACIQEVSELLESNEAMPQLIRAVKTVQQRWKQIGITNRSTDQKLWKAFRKQCDAIFARRDAEKKSAPAIPGQPTEKPSGEPGPVHAHEVSALSGAFKARAKLCDQLELGGDVSQIEIAWRQQASLPERWEKPLLERKKRASTGRTVYAHCNDLEELCVRIELLAELTSPEVSSPLRLKLQVERLERQFAKGQREVNSRADRLADLQSAWYSLSPGEQTDPSYHLRFSRAETLLESASS